MAVPIQRDNVRSELWNVVILLTTTAVALAIPFRLVFGLHILPRELVFEIAVTLVLTADFVLRAFRFRGEEGRTSVIWLAADFVAALPFDLLLGPGMLSLLRLVKVTRVAQILQRWKHRNPGYWNQLRLAYFIYWFAICVHWLSSGWLNLRGIPPDVPFSETYIEALYWCMTTLTTVGYGDITPQSTREMLYAIMVEAFGIAMYGYIIGNIATLIVNLDPARARFRENMEKLGAFMSTKNLTRDLRDRMRDYFTYAWQNRGGIDETAILEGLPPGLKADVSVYLKRDIIQKVPFFKGVNEDLLRTIALKMRPLIYMPGDVVFREGSIGREMFFISRGRLEVLGRDGTTVMAVLHDGDIVGEMALLSGQPRNATVRALDVCDLYVLDKATFDRILADHPEFSAYIARVTDERLQSGSGPAKP